MVHTPIIKEEGTPDLAVLNMNDKRLRKVISDISYEFDWIAELGYFDNAPESTLVTPTIQEVKQVECECCGLKEDCTQDYITSIKQSHSGNWVCGLCSEAVKDRLVRTNSMEEALSSHLEFCQKFNTTTRLNPKLAFTNSMRDFVKKFGDRKHSPSSSSTSKLGRSNSCQPRIHVSKH